MIKVILIGVKLLKKKIFKNTIKYKYLQFLLFFYFLCKAN